MSKNSPVTFCTRNGKQYIRTRQPDVNRTEGTKRSAGLFGKASTTSSQLKATFAPLLGYPSYAGMYDRLNSSLRGWMQMEASYPQKPLENIIGLMGFRFIEEVGIFNRFTAEYHISYAPGGDVTVDIPAFTPKEKVDAPRGCTAFELKLMAASCKPFEKEIVDFAAQDVTIPYNNLQQAALHMQLPLQAANDTLTLVAMALKYNNIEWGTFADKRQLRWMPAGVIGCLWK